jgi:hypothetical protein
MMLRNPREEIPPDRVGEALDALLRTLAQDEPEALARAIQTLAGTEGDTAGPSVGETLGKAYLACAGNGTPAVQDPRRHRFAYPAYVQFVVDAGSVRAAKRIARTGIAALLESAAPLGALPGPFPDQRELRDVTLWLEDGDVGDLLELESVDE